MEVDKMKYWAIAADTHQGFSGHGLQPDGRYLP
jgi:hypothetical protein